MSLTSLQMISLGSLLLFGDRALGRSGCIDKDKVDQRVDRFERGLDRPADSFGTNRTFTCADAAQLPSNDLRTRSLSPWIYWVDQNDRRRPRKIFMVKCLCQGCIINQQETYTYNSVEVTRTMKVLYIEPCENEENKLMVKQRSLKVPVACVCIMPKYAA